MYHVLKSEVTLVLSFGGSTKPHMAAACLQPLPESFPITLAEGKFMKHMNKRWYIVASLMVRVFLRDNIKQVDMFPKWPPNSDWVHEDLN